MTVSTDAARVRAGRRRGAASAGSPPDKSVGRDDEIVRRQELGWYCLPRQIGGDERAGDLGEVAAGRTERRGNAVDKSGRRRIGDEMTGEPRGDVDRRGRARGKIGEDRQALLDATLPVAPAHDRERAGLVAAGRKPAGGAHRQGADAPAGHRAGERGDVGLGVAGGNADGVELHHLAGEVLVQPRRCGRAAGECGPID